MPGLKAEISCEANLAACMIFRESVLTNGPPCSAVSSGHSGGQIFCAISGQHLWRETYRRDPVNLVPVSIEFPALISKELNSVFQTAANSRADRLHPLNLEILWTGWGQSFPCNCFVCTRHIHATPRIRKAEIHKPINYSVGRLVKDNDKNRIFLNQQWKDLRPMSNLFLFTFHGNARIKNFDPEAVISAGTCWQIIQICRTGRDA